MGGRDKFPIVAHLVASFLHFVSILSQLMDPLGIRVTVGQFRGIMRKHGFSLQAQTVGLCVEYLKLLYTELDYWSI